MFTLLRAAFWLTLILAVVPFIGSKPVDQTVSVDASEAMVAAGAAVSDMSGFCDRQPGACEIGTQAAVAIGQRAQAGARMVYEFINDQMTKGGATGSVPESSKVLTGQSSLGLRGTLKASDHEPAWHGPGATDAVPLPRKDPRHKA
jgi:hypothetical protein